MIKLWLLEIPILLSLFSCEAFHTGGNPNEGFMCSNKKILRTHAGSLVLHMTAKCSYEKVCDVDLYFYVTELTDSLRGMCFGGGVEWRLDSFDTSMVVKDWKNYPISLTPDKHAQFSLVDEDDIEKKYDIDLSGIVNSYMVRGDSVDVNVMKHCSLQLYSCKKETVYGNNLYGGKYTFATTDGCDSDYSHRCLWDNVGTQKNDNLEISASIYWKK